MAAPPQESGSQADDAAPKPGVLLGVAPNRGVLEALGRLAAPPPVAPNAGVLENEKPGVCMPR